MLPLRALPFLERLFFTGFLTPTGRVLRKLNNLVQSPYERILTYGFVFFEGGMASSCPPAFHMFSATFHSYRVISNLLRFTFGMMIKRGYYSSQVGLMCLALEVR